MTPATPPLHAPTRWRAFAPRYADVPPGLTPYAYKGFHTQLFDCAAGVLAKSGGGDMVFVGRSPASVRDLLRGALQRTSWSERLHALPLSVNGLDLEAEPRPDLGPLYRHFDACGLSPRRLLRGRPIVFVDLVCSGRTFRVLAKVLELWCNDVRVPWGRVAPRLRFLCILEDPPPHLEHTYAQLLAPTPARLLTVPQKLWVYLGERQRKSSPSYTAQRWGGPVLPTRPAPGHFEARRQSHELFVLGASLRGRRRLLRRLGRKPALRHGWYRGLVAELSRHVGRQRRRRRSSKAPLFARFTDHGAVCY